MCLPNCYLYFVHRTIKTEDYHDICLFYTFCILVLAFSFHVTIRHTVFQELAFNLLLSVCVDAISLKIIVFLDIYGTITGYLVAPEIILRHFHICNASPSVVVAWLSARGPVCLVSGNMA